MTTYTARWLLPISRPPIPRGTVTVDRGTVVSVGDPAPPGSIDLGARLAEVNADWLRAGAARDRAEE
jgi:hypothetical protein